MSEFVIKFTKIISNSNNILITTHIAPDDDAIASVSLIREILRTDFDKSADIYITKGGYERTELSAICKDIKDIDDICSIVENYDLIIFVDGCEYKRFTLEVEILRNWCRINKSICIDHHIEMPDFEVSLKHIDVKYSSASEAICTLFENSITERSIEFYKCVMFGIMSDTNFLEFVRPDTINTLKVVDQLMKKTDLGVEYFKSIMSQMKYEVYRIISQFIENSAIVEVGLDKKFKMLITYSDLSDEFGYVNDARLDWLMIFSKRIVGIDLSCALCLSKEKDGVTMSFRSHVGGVDVSKIANIFDGGGHKMASGGKLKYVNYPSIKSSEAKEIIIDKLKETVIPIQ